MDVDPEALIDLADRIAILLYPTQVIREVPRELRKIEVELRRLTMENPEHDRT